MPKAESRGYRLASICRSVKRYPLMTRRIVERRSVNPARVDRVNHCHARFDLQRAGRIAVEACDRAERPSRHWVTGWVRLAGWSRRQRHRPSKSLAVVSSSALVLAISPSSVLSLSSVSTNVQGASMSTSTSDLPGSRGRWATPAGP